MAFNLKETYRDNCPPPPGQFPPGTIAFPPDNPPPRQMPSPPDNCPPEDDPEDYSPPRTIAPPGQFPPGLLPPMTIPREAMVLGEG